MLINRQSIFRFAKHSSFKRQRTPLPKNNPMLILNQFRTDAIERETLYPIYEYGFIDLLIQFWHTKKFKKKNKRGS